jgi:trehalose 6-phosphate phosphatase
MIDLFSAAGRDAVARLAGQRTLYAFDFDGTLAPIVERPDAARAHPETERRLRALGAKVPTALVTGRAADDLRDRIDFAPLHVIGNHGAEGLPASLQDEAALAASRAIAHSWAAAWPGVLARHTRDAGIVFEPKAYSLSVHYRQSGDHPAAMRAIESAIGELDPAPRVITGKCVFNLLPSTAPDKGNALRSLVEFEHCTAAFFVGDDVTDEAAFGDAPRSWVTVHVGHADDSRARYFIDDQDAIDRCLDLLLASVGGG